MTYRLMLGVLTADMADPCQVNTVGKEVNSQDYTALDVWRLYVKIQHVQLISAGKCTIWMENSTQNFLGHTTLPDPISSEERDSSPPPLPSHFPRDLRPLDAVSTLDLPKWLVIIGHVNRSFYFYLPTNTSLHVSRPYCRLGLLLPSDPMK